MEKRRKNPPCDVHSKILYELEKDMYGSNGEGIKARFIRMEENIKSMKRFLYPMITAIFLGVVAMAGKMIIFTGK